MRIAEVYIAHVCSHDAPSYGVPRAKRIGITAEQFVQGCDGCLQRRLGATSVNEAKNMVARSKDPQFADELDEQTLRVGIALLCNDGCALPADRASRACQFTCGDCAPS
jgi:hypothetical protein